MPRNPGKNANQVLRNALACGATVEAAALKAGVSSATVYRRLKDKKFQAELQQTLLDMVKRTAGGVTALGIEAVRTLAELLKPTMPANLRLGAVRIALESGIKLREVADFEQRLLALEEFVAESQAAHSQ